MTTPITGRRLLDAGFPEGPAFGEALKTLQGGHITDVGLSQWVADNAPAPRMQLQTPPELIVNLDADTSDEEDNRTKVIETMLEVMKTPIITSGVVMPDACPAGPIGTIPVGGVVTSTGGIHPGMHSADICCSLMVTEFKDASPKLVLDAIHSVSHFGPGGRPDGKRFTLSPRLSEKMLDNSFLSSNKAMQMAVEHMGTQGDGNHFAFVGINNAGNVCLVTHHGSRGPGAFLYKNGMQVAEKMTRRLAQDVLKQNSWIEFDTREGEDYWNALQLIRKWTKANHSCLHAATGEIIKAKVLTRRWNEHNFVFQEGDLFHHAKGATPIHNDFLPDTDGIQILPLNMAQPVLLIEGERNAQNLGFAPHGAGRNMSRTKHRKMVATDFFMPETTIEKQDLYSEVMTHEVFLRETQGIDARFFSGEIDITELPSAYKNADSVRTQMEAMGLAQVVDEIQPFGCIMAGDWEKNAPWRKNKRSLP